MTTWMTLVDPKDHILKVSCHYLYFWLRYKDLLFFTKNFSDGQTLLNFNIDKYHFCIGIDYFFSIGISISFGIGNGVGIGISNSISINILILSSTWAVHTTLLQRNIC